MQICTTIATARKWVEQAKIQHKTIALVPTMGNLHAGHLQLVQQARMHADAVGVSIFVNPMQFGSGEDFDRYPRTLSEDCEKLRQHRVDFVFAPEVSEFYPYGTETHTTVTVPDLANRWCGATRPGHFAGVTTVILKLFHILEPQVACFGEKDFQQLRVVERLLEDLLLPIRILPVPIVREPDGLAMSSRNQYLSKDERAIAPLFYQTLQKLAEAVKLKNKSFRTLEQETMVSLEQTGFTVDYVAVCNKKDLTRAESGSVFCIILAAVYLGKTRLIDNIQC